MSRTQLVFNSGDLAFQEITTSRPNRNSATRVVSLDAVWSVTATFPITPLTRSWLSCGDFSTLLCERN